MRPMAPHVLRNLTLASAQHLVNQGHISKPHHAKIAAAAKVKAPAMAPNKPPNMGKAPKMGPPAMTQEQLEQPIPMGALDAASPVPAGIPSPMEDQP